MWATPTLRASITWECSRVEKWRCANINPTNLTPPTLHTGAFGSNHCRLPETLAAVFPSAVKWRGCVKHPTNL